MGLTLVTDAIVEPVSLDDVKDQLEIAASISSHDDKLNAMIKRARQLTEQYTRRAWINQTWRLTLSRFPDGLECIRLPRPPLSSVTSLTYVDSDQVTQSLVEDTDYVVRTNSHPGLVDLVVGQSWPTTEPLEPEAVTITYVAGYGSAATDVTEEVVKQGILATVMHWFMDRTAVDLPDHAKWLLASLRSGEVLGSLEVTA